MPELVYHTISPSFRAPSRTFFSRSAAGSFSKDCQIASDVLAATLLLGRITSRPAIISERTKQGIIELFLPYNRAGTLLHGRNRVKRSGRSNRSTVQGMNRLTGRVKFSHL